MAYTRWDRAERLVCAVLQVVASLKDTRDRIDSVKNTQKITEAMKLVAAAKVRRAQDAVINGRPFAENLVKVLPRPPPVQGTCVRQPFKPQAARSLLTSCRQPRAGGVRCRPSRVPCRRCCSA